MTDNAFRNGDKRFRFPLLGECMLVQREHMSNVAQIASPGSGVFSMKVYKECSVLDVRLLFLRDWSFKSECECDLWRPPLPETIGLPTGRVLCILVIVKNYGILGDFGLN